MYSKLFKTVFVVGLVAALLGCGTAQKKSASSAGITKDSSVLDRETFYTSTGNTRALVDLYRTILKQNEDAAVRFKLSTAYYDLGDHKASLLYLQPLLSDEAAVNIRLLEVANLTSLHKNNDALSAVNRLLKQYPKNAQAYNLKGVINAQMHHYKAARENFNQARALFADDVMILNNLAHLDILESKFKEAVELLLPVYMNGSREPRLMYNLAYALVKRGEIEMAKSIILNNNLEKSSDVDSLIETLREISPAKTPKAFKHTR